MEFKKAVRSARKLRLAIAAPSGGGKTYSALRIASGILETQNTGNGRIAFIDTENNSAAIYSDKFDFDVVNIDPPYSIKDFSDAIIAAREAGYPILIIDSSSHAWKQVLEVVDKITAASQSKNSYISWRQGTSIMEKWLQNVLYYPGHVIFCMRSKMEYALTDNGSGKKSVEKMGLAPVMRNEIEYEFDMMLDGNTKHYFEVSKTRFAYFDGEIIEKPDEEFGKKLIAYLAVNPVEITEPITTQKTKPAIVKPKPNQVVKPMPQDTPRKPATTLPDNKKYNIQHEPIDLSGGALLYDPATAHAAFDPLYKKILQGWNALKYHDIRRSNSIKKHLSVDCLNKCQDAQQLTDYIAYLREQYKAGLK